MHGYEAELYKDIHCSIFGNGELEACWGWVCKMRWMWNAMKVESVNHIYKNIYTHRIIWVDHKNIILREKEEREHNT